MLYRVYVEAYIYAANEEEAKSEGYDALQEKLACGMTHDVAVEEVDDVDLQILE